jgi:Rod binding domain-containing protein
MRLPIELYNTGKGMDSYVKHTNDVAQKAHTIKQSHNREDIQKVAKEMEALFAHQLIKVMRETAESMSSEKKGLGNSTYMSMFDMELSRLFADRGLGLQDALIDAMNRSISSVPDNISDNNE